MSFGNNVFTTFLPHLQDQIFLLVSSIFLHRLLLPGVCHSSVLRTTLQYYNRHFTDSEFDSLTVDGLKSEILSLIENEVAVFFPFSSSTISNPPPPRLPFVVLLDSEEPSTKLIWFICLRLALIVWFPFFNAGKRFVPTISVIGAK